MNAENTKESERPSLIERLYPRLLHFGIAYGDVMRLHAHRHDWGAWAEGLATQAGRYEHLGDAASTAGNKASAREWWRKAVDYYHFAQLRVDYGSKKRKLQDSSRRNFRKLASCHSVNIERLEVPFRTMTLPGYLRVAQGKAPCVVLIGGLDSAKEVELFYFSQYFLERGSSVLFFDGPGQGELCWNSAMTVNFESAVSAVIDYLSNRPLPTAEGFGLFGVSFGGYLACRAAATDNRIAACVSLGGFFDSKIAGRMLPFARAAVRHTFGLTTHDSLDGIFSQITLEPLRGRMHSPLLIVHGSDDQLVDEEQAHAMAAWADGCSELWMIEGAEHVCTNRFGEVLPALGDWMSATLKNLTPHVPALVGEQDDGREISRFESYAR